MSTERDWKAEFRDAEEAASTLTDSLSKLKIEMERYKSVSDSMEGSSEALQALAAQFSGVVKESAAVLHRLSELNTPELRDEVSGVKQLLSSTSEMLEKQVRPEVSEVKQLASSMKEDLEGLTQITKGLRLDQRKSRNLILAGLALALVILLVLVFR